SEHARPNPLLRPVTPAIARELVERIESHQTELLPRLGTRFVFAADELYLEAGLPIPPSKAYEEFGMLEDGIGMVRRFEDRLRNALRRKRPDPPMAPALPSLAVVSGTLFSPVLGPILDRIGEATGAELVLVPVENRYLGKAINVAGLLAGRDVARTLREAGRTGAAAIPAEMVSRANGLLLDDYTPERVQSESGVAELHVVDGPEDLLRLVREGRAGGKGRGTYGS
ncbi:MAG: DUF512 domain-containing protein, partial [Candidatus Latescibacterota bacterium]